MQDAAGHNVGVDGNAFHSSVHSDLGCGACHASITAYPHPDHPQAVKCVSCHAEEAAALVGSVHEHSADQPCTTCHGTAHAILPKDNPKSAVYPLNIPATCGKCHGDAAMAKQHHLANVYPQYMDSIHGYAVSQEGLLVAANCESCHGSHHVLSHINPKSPTYKTAIPDTCGKCHAGIRTQYAAGVHGTALAGGNLNAPSCTDCHTAHTIGQPNMAQSTPMCGSCHQAQLSTYRDTFHSQVSNLGSYVEVARCSDCHGEHEILPASDPRSPVNSANLVKTCGRCHQGANAGFVKYSPHANPHNRKTSPVLYYIRVFMVLLISGVMTFFLLHSLLWLIRSLIEKANGGPAKGDK
jgi:Cytochrome c3